MQLTQDVTTRFFRPYFGTPGPDVKTLSDWARELFKFQFADINNDPKVLAEAKPIAEKMRDYVGGVIAEQKKDRGRYDDILERSLALQDEGYEWLTDEQIRNNLIGFIVGGLPQPPMIIPQLMDVLLDRPAELETAIKFAQEDDDVMFSKFLFEALRFNPLTPGLFRTCAKDYTVAEGAWRAKKISAGTTVFAATRSAMLDSRVFQNPKAFRIDRPEYACMHFGYGMHICFGVYINMQMVPAICKALLRKGSVRRKTGDEGTLQMDGIFAKTLVVQFGT
jgi:cytochrome P450